MASYDVECVGLQALHFWTIENYKVLMMLHCMGSETAFRYWLISGLKDACTSESWGKESNGQCFIAALSISLRTAVPACLADAVQKVIHSY